MNKNGKKSETNEKEIDEQAYAPHEEKLLGKKKLRILNLIEATKDEKSTNVNKKNESQNITESLSDSDSEKSDKEMEKYKNLISGKINIKNVLSNFHKKEEISAEEISPSKKATNIEKNSNILSLLPAPKKKLSDKIQMSQILIKKKTQNFFEIGGKFKDLANPDSDIIHKEKISYSGINNILGYVASHNNSNTYSFNVDDQIDKNWELKYLHKLEAKEDTAEFEELSRQQINKNHIKALISDHKKAKAIKESESEASHSKYTKISTRNKYGW
jgi:hypothetical protein